MIRSALRAGASLVAALIAAPDDPNRRGNSYAVTLITPIERDRDEDLRAVLAGFGRGSASPLADVPNVHFARWVVVDQLKVDWDGAPTRPTQLASPYLLFTADVTAPDSDAAVALPESFFRDLVEHIPVAAHRVWAHCLGCPPAADGDAFVRYLASSRLDASLYFAAFPDTTVAEIRHALAVHDALVAFVQERQGLRRPEVLQREYLEASHAWFA